MAKRSRISAHAAGVGERIRAARVRRGMTEAELACAAGVTCRQVRSFEAGASRIATPRLKAVAAVLGISEAVLRGEIDSVSISRYKDSPAFYIYNNEEVTSTAYGIEDVADVINEALAARKEETEEADNG